MPSICAPAFASPVAEYCSVAQATLPIIDASESELLYVYNEVQPNSVSPRLVDLFEESFELWNQKDDCDLVELGMACFTLINSISLDSGNWEDIEERPLRRLDQCGSWEQFPRITTQAWDDLAGTRANEHVTDIIQYELESVILSKDENKALVSMNYVCGRLCGEWFSLLLEKQPTGWAVIGKVSHGVS